jgi:hypothetical protein
MDETTTWAVMCCFENTSSVLGWALCIRGLSDPATHQCTIQKIPFWGFMDGMKVSPRGQFTWSVFFFQPNFYSLAQFFLFWGQFLFHFFFGPPLNQRFFYGKLLLTTLLPTNPPPSLMLPTPPHLTICAHFLCPLVLLSPSPSQDKW